MMEPLYRVFTGSGLTRRQLFWGAALILVWFTMDVTGFYLDHVHPLLRPEPASPFALQRCAPMPGNPSVVACDN